jgi:hypothetical protein
MKRRDRVVEVASRLAEARAEVARLEEQLDGLLGGGKERADEGEGKPVGSPAPAPNGHATDKGGRKPSPLHAQVVELTREGLTPPEIASKLGLEGRSGLVKVHQNLYRARAAGELPKAGLWRGQPPKAGVST